MDDWGNSLESSWKNGLWIKRSPSQVYIGVRGLDIGVRGVIIGVRRLYISVRGSDIGVQALVIGVSLLSAYEQNGISLRQVSGLRVPFDGINCKSDVILFVCDVINCKSDVILSIYTVITASINKISSAAFISALVDRISAFVG